MYWLSMYCNWWLGTIARITDWSSEAHEDSHCAAEAGQLLLLFYKQRTILTLNYSAQESCRSSPCLARDSVVAEDVHTPSTMLVHGYNLSRVFRGLSMNFPSEAVLPEVGFVTIYETTFHKLSLRPKNAPRHCLRIVCSIQLTSEHGHPWSTTLWLFAITYFHPAAPGTDQPHQTRQSQSSSTGPANPLHHLSRNPRGAWGLFLF